MTPKKEISTILEQPLLKDMPFYKAVRLFEENNLSESLVLFTQCAQTGNIYAFHYIKHILDSKYDIEQTTLLSEAQKNFLRDEEQFEKYFKELPTDFFPDSWLYVSLLKKNNVLQEVSETKKIDYLIKLAELSHWCSYAYGYLDEILPLDPSKSTSEVYNKRLQTIWNLHVIDVSALFYESGTDYLIAPSSEQVRRNINTVNKLNRQELIYFEKFSLLAKGQTGNIERLIAQKVYGDISHRQQNIPALERLTKWQRAGAMMGNMILQRTLGIKPKPFSVDNQTPWLKLAALSKDCISVYVLSDHLYDQKKQQESIEVLKSLKNLERLPSYLQGTKNPMSILSRIHQLGLHYDSQGQHEKAHYYLNSAYKHGFHEAGVTLVDMYMKEGNYVQAEKESNKLLKLKKFSVQEVLALIYSEGLGGVAKQREAALELFLSCLPRIKQYKYPESYGKHANLLFSKESATSEDLENAVSLCQEGIKKQDPNSALKLANAFIHNEIICNMVSFEYLEQSLTGLMTQKAWAADCSLYLAKIYIDRGEYAKAKKSLEDGKQHANLEQIAQINIALASIYETGKIEGYLGRKGLEQAKNLYKDHLDFSPQVRSNYGYLMFTLATQPKEYTQAEKILKEAFQEGARMAAYNLWGLYNHHYEKLAINQDEAQTQAFKYLEQINCLQDPDVQHDLGHAYFTGTGCEVDLHKSIQHLRTAVQLGLPKACFSLASTLSLQVLNSETIDTKSLREIVTLMQRCLEETQGKLQEASIPALPFYFQQGLFLLLEDPNKVSQVLASWKPLVKDFDTHYQRENAAIKNHYRATYHFLDLCQERKKNLSREIVKCFFFAGNIGGLSRALDSICQSDLQKEPVSETTDSSLKLLERIDEFLESKPTKKDLTNFNQIVRQLSSQNIVGSFQFSEGSGSRVKWKGTTTSGETFVHHSHQSHGRESIDPGKGKDLREAMRGLAAELRSRSASSLSPHPTAATASVPEKTSQKKKRKKKKTKGFK